MQAAFLENRQDEFFGGAGIGGAFENDELAALEIRRDGQRCLFDVAEVGFAALVKRSGNADQNRVHVAQAGEVGSGVEMFRVHVGFDFFRGNVLDVGLAGVQLIDLGFIEVEARDALADVCKPECERKSHVAAADDANFDALPSKKFRFPLHAYAPCDCFEWQR